MNRRKGNGGFSNFISGLIGAILGGFLVFALIGNATFKSFTKNGDKDGLKSSDKDQVVNINTNESTTMERAVVKKSIDSVVGITTKTKASQQSLFGLQTGYVEGVGSGSIVSKDGYILTNSHVVSNGDASEINVLLSDKKTLKAKLVWNDSTLDLAVIKVEGENLPAIEMGNSDKVNVGDKAVAIGNPLGLQLQSTVTSGIISGLNRTVSFSNGAQMDGLMQTDAAINSGNSGGALLNSKGQLIGINTAKAGNSDGIGFAIPVNLAKTVVDQIAKTGKFNSVYLGITGVNMDILKQTYDIDKDKFGTDSGVYVQSVFDDKGGNIKKGDIIVGIDGKDVKDMSSLKKLLLNYNLGDSAKITVYREGKKKDISFKFSIDTSNVDKYKQASPETSDNGNPNNENGEDNGDTKLPDWLLP